MKRVACIVLLAAAFGLGALSFRACNPGAAPQEPTVRRDTVIVRDTIRLPAPKPVVVTVVRYDTLRVQTAPVDDITPPVATVTTPRDTMPQITPENDIIVPITRNVYRTDDYAAVVEGYRPRLVSIELYPKITTVTNTITNTRSPRWALTVGPGVGYGPGGIRPYIGVNVGIVLWSR